MDGTPIRVFKNNTNIGVDYLVQAMQIEVTIWNETPFQAHYEGFDIDDCLAHKNTIGFECFSPTFSWNGVKYWKFDPQQQRAYEDVRNKHLVYDYCSVGPKPPLECQSN